MTELQIDGRTIMTVPNHGYRAGDIVEMQGISGKPRPFRLAHAGRDTFSCAELTRWERIAWRLRCARHSFRRRMPF